MAGKAKEPTKLKKTEDVEEDSLGGELSQDEIDSLLGTGGSEDPTTAGIQSVIEPSRVTYEPLPTLEVIFEHLAWSLSSAFRKLTGSTIEVSVDKVGSTRFGAYVESLPAPAFLSLFEAMEWEGSALIHVDTPLVYSLVNILLGGGQGPGMPPIEGRLFTSIERNLVERVVKLVIEHITTAFSRCDPVTFQFTSLETDPRLMTFGRPANVCFLAQLKVDMGHQGGCLDVLIPYATLEPVRHKLLERRAGDKLGHDRLWQDHLGKELWNTRVDMKAELAPVPLSLKEIMNWKPGDQIVFNEKPDSSVKLTCGNEPLFRGQVGQKEGKVSIKIEQCRR